jgi:hypothetical protein
MSEPDYAEYKEACPQCGAGKFKGLECNNCADLRKRGSGGGSAIEVVVTDIRMPFWSMVGFMIKWALAAIPAVLILFFIFGLAAVLIQGVTS